MLNLRFLTDYSFCLELSQLLKCPALSLDQFTDGSFNERLNGPFWLKCDEESQILVQLRR
jgi:hypothetical protein